ncbi:MAG TPA: hypothetical protein DEB40_03155 [Elusimicrobia bacterium]|nr:hypothetical protein [Elusimicrobiota bacterium]HBT60729.1 hypothetical protein [Elusimicrobiota bacterium]
MSERTDVLAKDAHARIGRHAPGAGGSYLVEVNLKRDFCDADGLSALWMLHCAGVTAARAVRVGRLYELRGNLNLGHVQVAARELLCDGVTQEFRVGLPAASPDGGGCWRVEVWLKATVTDAVGESVRGALIELGLPDPSVRCGAAYHIAGKCNRNQLEKAVVRFLANSIIHRFSVSAEN